MIWKSKLTQCKILIRSVNILTCCKE